MVKSTDRQYYLLGLKIAGDFGVAIATPVVVFAYVGRWLDGRWGGGWRFTVIAFVVSALLSGLIIYRKAKKYGEEYQKL